MAKQRVGIISTWFPSGAGYVSRQYKELLDRDFEVFVYARGGHNEKNNLDWDGPNVTWAPSHSEITGIYWNHFKKWIDLNGIEILFFNEQRYWPTVIESKKYGIKIGAYVDYYTQDTVPFFDVYDFLICNTRRHYSVFSWHKSCFYVPWGVSEKRWPISNCQSHREVHFMISAGWDGAYSAKTEWMDRRGTGRTLKAFRSVVGDCKLLVYSQVQLDKCPEDWRNIINEDDRIDFIFGTFEPFPFHEADVYLYPSRLDGIGLTLPEAICAGLAVVTTNSAPMNEFVTDNYNGFLIDVERQVSRPDGYYWPESIISENHLSSIIQIYVDNKSILNNHQKASFDYSKLHLKWNNNINIINGIFASAYPAKKISSVKLVSMFNYREPRHITPTIFLKKIVIWSLGYIRSFGELR